MSAGSLLLAAGILGGLGLAFAALIALAHRRLHVWEDPRLEGVIRLLPGTNCGACGFPGCRGFAEQLVGGRTSPATCTVMAPDQRTEVAEFLGVEVGAAAVRVARLLCAGGTDGAVVHAEYHGLATCAAAAAVAGGGRACTWGCLWLGDCVRACTFDAIRLNAVGLPVVLPERCTACGDCVDACPKGLFVLMPLAHRLLVQCRNLLEGDAALAQCPVACNACGRCAADAPGLIAMQDGLAVIHYDRYELASPAAIARCPTGAITWVDGAQFAEPAPRTQGAIP